MSNVEFQNNNPNNSNSIQTSLSSNSCTYGNSFSTDFSLISSNSSSTYINNNSTNSCSTHSVSLPHSASIYSTTVHNNTTNDSSLFSSNKDSISQSQSQPISILPFNPQPASTTINNEAATVHQCIDKWLNVIQQMRSSTKCSLSVSELDELQHHIQYGITLQLDSEPSNIHYSNTTTVDDNHASVAERISEYISIGAVQPLPSNASPPLLVQPLHVILKDGKKPRLVIDLSRNLNQLLPHTSFKYASVHDAVLLSTNQCFYSKLDISNCFLSFPLHPSVYKYFVFQFDGTYYQFTRLPFGLSTAPRVCTLLLSVIQFVLEQKQLTLVRYLDDFLFISSSFQSASQHLATAIQVFQEFGLVVNQKKTEGPAQEIQFLGIILNSIDCTLSISQQRIDEMNQLLHYHISTPASVAVKVKDIMSFTGKLAFVSQVLVSARPFMRRLLDAINGKRKQQRCRLPIEFKLDCAIWLQRIHQWNGLISWSIHTQPPFVIISDASITGFGFYLQSFPDSINIDQLPTAMQPGHAVSGTWHSNMSHLLTNRSIAYLELFSVLYALTMLAPVLHNHSVLILTDNASNVPVINKQRTRSSAIITLLRAMAELSATHVFSCSARHISGESNILADFLSRPQLHQYAHLSTWQSYKQSNCLSDSLTHVTVVCSSSLHLPNPTPQINHSQQAQNVNLSYLPSLISSPKCHFEPIQNDLINHINKPSFDSVNQSI